MMVHLFLTDEVRLHCGKTSGYDEGNGVLLFLTDEVRLHCGETWGQQIGGGIILFLTDEVRLHCGFSAPTPDGSILAPFPDR